MRIKIPINIIELEPDNFHIMISSVFTDGNSVNWIIDTGASKTVFNKTLVEGELQLEPGNTLIFYTDGFTEAMNVKGEEYGDEKFLEFLRKYSEKKPDVFVAQSFLPTLKQANGIRVFKETNSFSLLCQGRKFVYIFMPGRQK